MDIGAPVGVVNSQGIPAMSFIAEKMPEVAYHALTQYVLIDFPKKQAKYFLSTLGNYEHKEKTIEKSPLEVPLSS